MKFHLLLLIGTLLLSSCLQAQDTTTSLAPTPVSVPKSVPASKPAPPKPAVPWPADFPLDIRDADKLTAADIVGPDGLVYPDFRGAGIPGGIPNVPTILKVTDFGATPNDETDDSDAIQKAVNAAGEKGGGGVLLPAGTYLLKKSVVIGADKVVVRGEGADKTKVRFELDAQSDIEAPSFGPRGMVKVRGSAAFIIQGRGGAGQRAGLAEDLPRGASVVKLKAATVAKPGDYISIRQNTRTPRRRLGMDFSANSWVGIEQIFQVEAVEDGGRTVRLNQPARVRYEAESDGRLERWEMIEGSGLENLRIDAKGRVSDLGVVMKAALKSWMRSVEIYNAGSNSFNSAGTGSPNKWCEVRDCLFDSIQVEQGGQRGYIGWEGASDCLMDNIETRFMRHAPNMQFNANGCVIRNGKFFRSDMQYHGYFPFENLYENNVVDADFQDSKGSYGWAAWTTVPADMHFMTGPRNVIYNNDISAPTGGFILNGGNEAMMLVYNRVRYTSAPGVVAQSTQVNNVVAGNVFAQRMTDLPLVATLHRETAGLRLWDNRIYGSSGQLMTGPGQIAEASGNVWKPYENAPSRPTPPVPSLLDWQRAHADEPRLCLLVEPRAVTGGKTAKAYIARLQAVTGQPLTVKIQSAEGLSTPATVTIPAGRRVAEFKISAAPVTGEKRLKIVATAPGLAKAEYSNVVFSSNAPREWPAAKREVLLKVAPNKLPTPWRADEFGVYPTPMKATGDGTQFSITAANTRLEHLEFGAALVFRPLRGDGVLLARLAPDSDDKARSGVLFFTQLSALAPMVWVENPNIFMERTGMTGRGWKRSKAGFERGQERWFKIERRGDEIIISLSPDGTTWKEVERSTLPGIAPEAYVGFFVSSGDPQTQRTVRFDRVHFEGESWEDGGLPVAGTGRLGDKSILEASREALR